MAHSSRTVTLGNAKLETTIRKIAREVVRAELTKVFKTQRVQSRSRRARRDDRLRRHFGAVDLGRATGADNKAIDADLAKAYGASGAGEQ